MMSSVFVVSQNYVFFVEVCILMEFFCKGGQCCGQVQCEIHSCAKHEDGFQILLSGGKIWPALLLAVGK